jgi:predicted dehydrogenase
MIKEQPQQQHQPKELRIGVIGLGYWGPNLVRVLDGLPGCSVTALCDLNVDRLKDFCDRIPTAFGTTDVAKILTKDAVDAIVIATPTKTHFELARQALSQGIHTFIEKPLATSSQECQILIDMADANHLKLFVGHIFLHSAPVAKLKEMVRNDDFGDIYYMSSTRLNLGPVRHDVSALWDLAPHDISIMLELMGSAPVSVNCSGLAHLNESIHDVCTLNMQFENNRMGIVHVSWLDPHKKREMTVVGSKKMAIYNDLEPLEKIKVYDNGIEYQNGASDSNGTFADFQVSYRYGDMFCPRIVEVEPLKAELGNFVECIIDNKLPKTDGRNGLDVVRVIEAANFSLLENLGDVELAPLAGTAANNTAMANLN